MELSMEKTKITDVREGFDFLGYRIAQVKMPSTGRHVGMLFIPKGKSQLLRDKIKVKVRETPTGRTLADLIDHLNPVITGWRNYYRYATRSGKEFAKHDWWLYWRLKAWLGKKHGGASGRKLRRRYAEPGARQRGGWRSDRQKARPVRRHQAPALPGPGTTHTERMERPSRTLPQGSRQVLGSDPRPRIIVRDTRGASHAWRAGCGETRTSGSERGMRKPASATG